MIILKKIVLLLLVFAILLSGCSKSGIGEDTDTEIEVPGDTRIDDGGIININEDLPDLDSLVIDFPKADESLVVPIFEAKANFQSELEEISATYFENFEFGDVKVANFPDISEFSLIMSDDTVTMLGEEIEATKKYIEFFYPEGANEEFYRNEIRSIVSGEEFGCDEDKEFPYSYPSSIELYEEYGDRFVGGGVVVDTEDLHMQVIGGVIYSMGLDGISKLNNGEKKFNGGFKDFDDEYENLETALVNTFYAPYFSDKKYKVSGGEYSTNEVAEFVKDYFENQLPYKAFEGVEVDVVKILVYSLSTGGYGFEVHTRRVYESLPFDNYKYSVMYSMSSDEKSYYEDSKIVNIIDYGKVESFHGSAEAKSIMKMGEAYTDIIPLKTATEIAVDKLARFSLRVDELELVYCFVQRAEIDYSSYYFRVAVPWWKYTCWYGTSGFWMNVYVNALTGEVRYVGQL